MTRAVRFVAPVAIVAIVLVVMAGPAWACMDSKLTAADRIEAHPEHAAALLPKINAERASIGLAPMAVDAAASAIAQDFARQLAAKGTLWHNDAYFTSSTRASLRALALGENVACNWSLDAAHVALMASPGHRANILDPRFTAVGLAVVSRPDGALYIAEDFLQPSGIATAAAAPAVARPSASAPVHTQVRTASAAPSLIDPTPVATTTRSRTAAAAPSGARADELATAPIVATRSRSGTSVPPTTTAIAALVLAAGAGLGVRRIRRH